MLMLLLVTSVAAFLSADECEIRHGCCTSFGQFFYVMNVVQTDFLVFNTPAEVTLSPVTLTYTFGNVPPGFFSRVVAITHNASNARCASLHEWLD